MSTDLFRIAVDGAIARSRILLLKEMNYGQVSNSNGSQSLFSSKENTYFRLGLIEEGKNYGAPGEMGNVLQQTPR